MTNNVEADAAVAGESSMRADERLVYRGPIQRLLVSPEVGALIGAVLVWAFFWGNGNTFGWASSTLNWLDVAAPLGIMAVVVAMLMIGGEFDLSSGVTHGASAILIGLMAKYFMGTGVNIGIAIGVAFLAAGAIGWFNGTMVNRTGLPSFIVTLGTFFVLQGLMLVITKRREGKVQVTDLQNTKGFKFWKSVFAHEWQLRKFSGRDTLFIGLVIVCVVLLAMGLLEQSFIRRGALHPQALVVALVGAGLAALGFMRLQRTDGVGPNALWSVVGGVGAVAAAVFAVPTDCEIIELSSGSPAR